MSTTKLKFVLTQKKDGPTSDWWINWAAGQSHTPLRRGEETQHQNKPPLVRLLPSFLGFFFAIGAIYLLLWRYVLCELLKDCLFSFTLTWMDYFFSGCGTWISSGLQYIFSLFLFFRYIHTFLLYGGLPSLVWYDTILVNKVNINMWRVILLCVTLTWSLQSASTITHEGMITSPCLACLQIFLILNKNIKYIKFSFLIFLLLFFSCCSNWRVSCYCSTCTCHSSSYVNILLTIHSQITQCLLCSPPWQSHWALIEAFNAAIYHNFIHC